VESFGYNMKVYLGYECYYDYDYCEIWRSVIKVFDDEVKALVWKEEGKSTEQEWREYEEMEVE
jgi:hypothetical protein